MRVLGNVDRNSPHGGHGFGMLLSVEDSLGGDIESKNTLPSQRRSFLLRRASVWMTVIQCRWGLYNGDYTG